MYQVEAGCEDRHHAGFCVDSLSKNREDGSTRRGGETVDSIALGAIS